MNEIIYTVGRAPREHYYKIYDPVRGRFGSMHGRFTTLEEARRRRKDYIKRLERGQRLDTKEWMYDTVIVKVDSGKNIIEMYCGNGCEISDLDPEHHVCEQAIRVIDPELLD